MNVEPLLDPESHDYHKSKLLIVVKFDHGPGHCTVFQFGTLMAIQAILYGQWASRRSLRVPLAPLHPAR